MALVLLGLALIAAGLGWYRWIPAFERRNFPRFAPALERRWYFVAHAIGPAAFLSVLGVIAIGEGLTRL
jgi:hypothetical protein